MNKDLVTAKKSVGDLLASADVQRELGRAISEAITVDKLLRVSLTLIKNTPKLLECSKASLLTCIMGAGQLGLSPQPFLGQCYFVPYYNSVKRILEAVLIPGYRGYITLAKRSGELSNLSAQVVYTNDTFEYSMGTSSNLYHVLSERDRGIERGAWCVFNYKDGAHTFDYMPISDINLIMERTKSRDKKGNIVGPWLTDKDEMSKKTVIRRHMKLAPLSVEDLSRAVQAENLADAGLDQAALFSPETQGAIELDGPDEPGADPVEEFDAMFSTDNKKKSADLNRFLARVCEHLNKSINEVKTEAMENPEEFKDNFFKWAAAEKQKKDAAAKEKKEKKAAEKAKKEAENKQKQTENGKTEVIETRKGEPVFMQSMEYNELMLEKETNADLYKKAIDVYGDPSGVQDCLNLLNFIDKGKGGRDGTI